MLLWLLSKQNKPQSYYEGVAEMWGEKGEKAGGRERGREWERYYLKPLYSFSLH